MVTSIGNYGHKYRELWSQLRDAVSHQVQTTMTDGANKAEPDHFLWCDGIFRWCDRLMGEI